ncbi:MAG: UbiX family flavin prenyltransferase [Methylococcales bacterium]|jgi:flavin prenyltransferase|nr:UbiX family flavin prenyltransferase [Methylococcales bacterium]MBT7445196.1 UbiX family flavin prenyltransferase [Methylococcales bacterium]
MPKTIAVAMTGASGAQYGLRLIQCLLDGGHRVYLMVSQPAQIVINTETELTLPSNTNEMQAALRQHFKAADDQLFVFGRQEWMAPVASGTNPPDAMVVCPCTSGTLSAIACGSSNNLMERAADVMLKEQRKLVIVLRETPLSVIHLENMLKLAKMGVVMMPANPGFYQQPKSIDDLIDFMVARILDHLHIEHGLIPRWGEK